MRCSAVLVCPLSEVAVRYPLEEGTADVLGRGGAAAVDGDRRRGAGRCAQWRAGDLAQRPFVPRVLDTRLGSLQLRIPKLRQGSYFPPVLEARKVSENAPTGRHAGAGVRWDCNYGWTNLAVTERRSGSGWDSSWHSGRC